jgi:hypothetical protein
MQELRTIVTNRKNLYGVGCCPDAVHDGAEILAKSFMEVDNDADF